MEETFCQEIVHPSDRGPPLDLRRLFQEKPHLKTAHLGDAYPMVEHPQLEFLSLYHPDCFEINCPRLKTLELIVVTNDHHMEVPLLETVRYMGWCGVLSATELFILRKMVRRHPQIKRVVILWSRKRCDPTHRVDNEITEEMVLDWPGVEVIFEETTFWNF